MSAGGLVVLVHPGMGFYDSVAKDIPLALLSAARNVDFIELVLVDQRVAGWKRKLDDCLRKHPVALCFTALTGQQTKHALEISRYVKSADKRVPVVWGGIHPTFAPESTIRNASIDLVVTGEAEYAFPEVLKSLEAGDAPVTQGIWYRRENEVFNTGPPPEGPELDGLRFPRLDLLDFRTYDQRGHLNFGSVFPVETGRGCTWNCAFCYNSSPHRRKRRSMSAERILEHVHHLRRHVRFDGVNFIDDNFFADRERLGRLPGLLERAECRFVWGVETGVHELLATREDLLSDLERLGLRWLSIGVESGSQRILDRVGKKLKVEQVREVNAKLARTRISAMFNFMNGYIWEEDEDLKKTTSLILQVLRGNPNASVQAFQAVVPYPGTRYFREFERAGFGTPQTLEEWGDCNPDDWLDKQQWMTPRRKRLLKTLYVASLFIDRKIYSNAARTGLWVLALRAFRVVYRPLAWARLKFNWSRFPLEVVAFEAVKRLTYGKS